MVDRPRSVNSTTSLTISTNGTRPAPGGHGELPPATCPECAAPVTLDETPVVTEIVVCADCAAELEVLAVNPLELALAPEVEEDWGE